MKNLIIVAWVVCASSGTQWECKPASMDSIADYVACTLSPVKYEAHTRPEPMTSEELYDVLKYQLDNINRRLNKLEGKKPN